MWADRDPALLFHQNKAVVIVLIKAGLVILPSVEGSFVIPEVAQRTLSEAADPAAWTLAGVLETIELELELVLVPVAVQPALGQYIAESTQH